MATEPVVYRECAAPGCVRLFALVPLLGRPASRYCSLWCAETAARLAAAR